MLPNFLIAGTAKAGTTALYHYLQQHPDIFMSPMKETNFFIFEGQEVRFGGPNGAKLSKEYAITRLEDYEEQFEAVSGERAIGEASPWYLYARQTPENIHRHVPEAKIVVILRNPVQRAFSSYLHTVREGHESLPFEEGLAAEEQRVAEGWEYMWHYRRAGCYAKQIERYLKVFPRERMKIFLYEDLNSNIANVLREIFFFLEVDEDFVADTSFRPNATGTVGNRMVERLWLKPNPVKSAAKLVLPQKVRYGLNHRAYQWLLKKPEMEESLSEKLLDDYREDILDLEKILGRDLSGWLAPRETE